MSDNFYTNFFLRGDRLYIRGYENGIPFKDSYSIPAEFYIPGGSDAKDIYGNGITRKVFDSIKEAKNSASNYMDAGIDVFGFPKFHYNFIHRKYPAEPVTPVEFNRARINILDIDIETTVNDGFPDVFEATEEILLITVSLNGDLTTFVARDYDGVITGTKIIKCSDEADLITRFIRHFRTSNVHAVTGWNTSGFDLPYLANRIVRLFGDDTLKSLSPFGMVDVKDAMRDGQRRCEVDIKGIANLDYLEVYKKFVLDPRESYKLDVIADIELGEGKLSYPGTFREFYENDFTRFIQYNVRDVQLVDRLEAKLKLFDIIFTLSYIAKINYDDIFATTRLWDSIIANYLDDQNQYGPYDFSHHGDGYEGAYVKPTIAGFYQWVESFDLESLYPKLMVQYNISPEKMLDPNLFVPMRAENFLKKDQIYNLALETAIENDATLCLNGAMFSRNGQGFIPFLVEKMFNMRKSAKKESLLWKSRLQVVKAEMEKRGLST